MASLREEIEKRRTFAIISHPDAGKTTLTEKFLLYGGAINLAGTVKGRKSAKHAVSDWMEIEKERGISVTSSVLQFNYDGRIFWIRRDTRISRRIPIEHLWRPTVRSWSSTGQRVWSRKPLSFLRFA